MYDGKAVPSEQETYLSEITFRKRRWKKRESISGNDKSTFRNTNYGIHTYIRTYLRFFVVIIIIVIGVGISAQEGAIAHVLKRLFLNALAIARK